MGFGVKGSDGRSVVFILFLVVLAFILMLIFLVVSYFAYVNWFKASSSEKSERVSTTSLTPKAMTKSSGLMKSAKNFYSDLTGGRVCGQDRECFDEAALSCKKASFTLDTGRVLQYRLILGEDGEDKRKCVVYYEITSIKDEKITPKEWFGLNMTCKLNPEDIKKDILSVEKPDCVGALWDKLRSYAGK